MVEVLSAAGHLGASPLSEKNGNFHAGVDWKNEKIRVQNQLKRKFPGIRFGSIPHKDVVLTKIQANVSRNN